MKKQSVYKAMFLAVLLCVLCLMVVPSASAHQIKGSPNPYSTPQASGGGCSSPTSNYNNDIQNIKSCISYNYPQLLPDAYVTFRPIAKYGGISACSITIYLYDFDTDQLVAKQSYNCSVAASRSATNAHFGPFVYNDISGTYYSFTSIVLHYNNGNSDAGLSNDSPVQNIP